MIVVIFVAFCKNESSLRTTQATINCGYKDSSRPDWLIPMDKDKLPQPAKEMFPKKAKFQVKSITFVEKRF